MSENLSQASLMVHTSDLMYCALKFAKRRWYVVLILAVLCASPILYTLWRVHKIQTGITQLKIDNPHIKAQDWKNAYIQAFDLELDYDDRIGFNRIPLLAIGNLKTIDSLKILLSKDIELVFAGLFNKNNFYRPDLHDFNTLNLSALKKIPIQHLDLSWTQFTDLNSIKGIPLKSLKLNSSVGDISPLKGMPLEYLRIEKLTNSDILDNSFTFGIPPNNFKIKR